MILHSNSLEVYESLKIKRKAGTPGFIAPEALKKKNKYFLDFKPCNNKTPI
jgi:hypothetical protein